MFNEIGGLVLGVLSSSLQETGPSFKDDSVLVEVFKCYSLILKLQNQQYSALTTCCQLFQSAHLIETLALGLPMNTTTISYRRIDVGSYTLEE